MTVATDLVQFLMHLFGDRQAAQDFLDNPERVLEEHGLGHVCSADVDAAMPVVLDYAPITVNASRFDRDYNTGGNTSYTRDNDGGHTLSAAGGGHGGNGGGHGGGGHGGGGHHDHEDHEDHAHAVQQLHHVVNNYSYTSTVDDRDTITDQSVNQNIWADGDVEQWFDNDSVVASGDRAVAAGDDVDIEDSNNIEDSYNTDNSTDNSRDNSITAGRDASVGNTEIDDSFNTDVDADIDDSFNEDSQNDNSDRSDNSDHSTNTDVDVDIDDSFQDNSDHSTNTDLDIDESFNETDTTIDVEDSFNSEETNTEVDVELEDSFNDNRQETNTNIEDNVVVADNEVDYTNVEDNTVVADNELSYSEETTNTTDVDVEDVNVAGDDVNV